ncbi:metalloendopeptidase OMA1, mitochondrial-like [Mya arenaria]|uniref:metalloendopeptidase OMA1, mitochondrial-like n=1 Tax=Mya arenaria TaxID=6604 RepID=UPI0022E393D5|nr:metalloendopeptidase OMA1, mitochondrial-like [Mya arenaria]XP_052775975.1 metalloendopeptidase OMA1, mitochondrial-like [Mya arenaria]
MTVTMARLVHLSPMQLYGWLSKPPVSQLLRHHAIKHPPKYSLRKHCTMARPKTTSVMNTNIKGHFQITKSVGRAQVFHTSVVVRAPVWLLPFLKGPVLKFLAFVTGRTLRQARLKQSPEVQKKWLRYKLAFFGVVLSAIAIFTIWYYESHLEVTSTGRKRLMVLLPEQIQKIADESTLDSLEKYSEAGVLIPDGHPLYGRVWRVLERLIKGNALAEPGITAYDWHVHIIKDEQVNAHVFPNGHVFVNTGLLEFCTNDDMLAIILGHEVAHCLLRHAVENMSREQLLSYLISAVLAAIWCILPNDGLAIVTHWYFNKVIDIAFHKAFSRDMEIEADNLGFKLATRACFDVRESERVWADMSVVDDLLGTRKTSQWNSTHPSNENRVKYFQKKMPEALKLRLECGCPNPLPTEDPRLKAFARRRHVNELLAARGSAANIQALEKTRVTPRLIT